MIECDVCKKPIPELADKEPDRTTKVMHMRCFRILMEYEEILAEEDLRNSPIPEA